MKKKVGIIAAIVAAIAAVVGGIVVLVNAIDCNDLEDDFYDGCRD